MFSKVKFLCLYFISWVFFFECARALFLSYHFSKSAQLSFSSLLLSFLYGLRMDLSMAAYLTGPVCLFVLLSFFIPLFRKGISYLIYTSLVLFFVLLVITADLELFRHWGARIDATPLKYLSSPKEAWASISHLPVALILGLFIIVYAGLLFLFYRFISRFKLLLLSPARPVLLGFFLILAFTSFLIIPMRGGIQLAPLNQSGVYFSAHAFANQSAVNACWSFVHGIINERSAKNPYTYLPEHEAKKIVDSLYRQSDKAPLLINTSSPNIILIIWESFTEKATRMSREGIEVTPFFNALKKEGIYFSNLYASGDRTDKGLSAILSGYPALPKSSILRTPNKSARLSSLSKLFATKGYTTAFYYGGETQFANIKSYVVNNRFSSLTEKDDFRKEDLNSKWGAHDGVVANKIFADLASFEKPFFATWLTLSSHEPFDVPGTPIFKGRDNETKFLASHYYTDSVVHAFVQKCKNTTWWKNTLLIIVADHGHSMPENGRQVDNFKIPMLWIGGALKHTNLVIDKIASQLDLASTLVYQVGSKNAAFLFSKNIFDSTAQPWAYFTFNDGFGLIQSNGYFIFDNVGKRMIKQEGEVTPGGIKAGKALQQYTYTDFLNR